MVQYKDYSSSFCRFSFPHFYQQLYKMMHILGTKFYKFAKLYNVAFIPEHIYFIMSASNSDVFTVKLLLFKLLRRTFLKDNDEMLNFFSKALFSSFFGYVY